MKTPRIEKIKSVSIRRMQTFASAPIESVIVDISAWRPSFLPASFIIRVTLRTLIILEI